MYALAVGIICGLAKHYEEQLAIVHTHCMLKGDPECQIEVEAPACVAGSVKADPSL